MQEIYATTTVERNGKTYRLEPELTDIMASSRDQDELLWAWGAWHNTTGRKLKTLYAEFVGHMNEAARDNGTTCVIYVLTPWMTSMIVFVHASLYSAFSRETYPYTTKTLIEENGLLWLLKDGYCKLPNKSYRVGIQMVVRPNRYTSDFLRRTYIVHRCDTCT